VYDVLLADDGFSLNGNDVGCMNVVTYIQPV